MKVSIQTLGSLGDVLPYLGIATALRQRGIDVSVLAPADYSDLIRRRGIECATPPAFTLAEWNREAEARGTLKGPVRFALGWRHQIRPLIDTVVKRSLDAAADADLVLANPICAPARLAAQFHRIPFVLTALQPVISPTAEIPCALVWRPWQGQVLNRPGYGAVTLALRALEYACRGHRQRLALQSCERLDETDRHLGEPMPRITLLSPPLLSARPTDWLAQDALVAYPALGEGDELPAALQAFLDAGDPPICLTLGSRASSAEEGVQMMVWLRRCREAGYRVVLPRVPLQGDVVTSDVGVFMAHDVSHARLFPRCAAVIHHGGAGTTDTCLRAGVPQLLLPRQLDQFWISRRLCEAGGAVDLTRRGIPTGVPAGMPVGMERRPGLTDDSVVDVVDALTERAAELKNDMHGDGAEAMADYVEAIFRNRQLQRYSETLG